ncbi:MAG: methylenetetrahydrofolate reductase [NAD(P)H] [Flavobacteriales bacterium]|jgi:methylenetetrahydrofolate reductase (NADPH)|nr:methylenetetrahydrofolate reductase [NAD(P)H] [Flavobacteriales bacterium]
MDSKNSPFSIEFYPPRNAEGESRLDAVHAELAKLNPDYFSVTYGAGGSTKSGTRKLVMKYQTAGSQVAPHLSFGGTDEQEVLELLQTYKEAGIKRIVALRGDIPSGSGAPMYYRYANELVKFIREETGDYFHIEVACYPETHPEAKNFSSDVAFFKQKVDAGANSSITQYFYNVDAYFRFVDYCDSQGINVPIVPGVMPITNFDNLKRFSAKCGAEIPLWLGKRLEDFGDDVTGLKQFGQDVVTELCYDLLQGGAPGLHFYSMNLSKSVSQIWSELGLQDRNT